MHPPIIRFKGGSLRTYLHWSHLPLHCCSECVVPSSVVHQYVIVLQENEMLSCEEKKGVYWVVKVNTRRYFKAHILNLSTCWLRGRTTASEKFKSVKPLIFSKLTGSAYMLSLPWSLSCTVKTQTELKYILWWFSGYTHHHYHPDTQGSSKRRTRKTSAPMRNLFNVAAPYHHQNTGQLAHQFSHIQLNPSLSWTRIDYH